MTTYRISVGKRHKVEPRQIVGALANEGGLARNDFGKIDIRMDHSLVDLPKNLPAGAWEALKETRISGKLIELAQDNGPRRSSGGDRGGYKGGDRGGYRGDRDDRPRRDYDRKPRHKD